jgi:hypothetical protein
MSSAPSPPPPADPATPSAGHNAAAGAAPLDVPASVVPRRLARRGLLVLVAATSTALLLAGLALDHRNAVGRSDPQRPVSARAVAARYGIQMIRSAGESEPPPDTVPLIALSPTQLIFDDEVLAELPPRGVLAPDGIDARYKGGDETDTVIAPLYERLVERRVAMSELDLARRNADGSLVREVYPLSFKSMNLGFPDERALERAVRLLADATTPPRIIREVVASAIEAGFGSVMLLVQTPSGELHGMPSAIQNGPWRHIGVALRVEVGDAGLSVSYRGQALGTGCAEGEGVTLPMAAAGPDLDGLLACVRRVASLNPGFASSPSVLVAAGDWAKAQVVLSVFDALRSKRDPASAQPRLFIEGFSLSISEARRRRNPYFSDALDRQRAAMDRAQKARAIAPVLPDAERVLARTRPSVRACYRQQLAHTPSLDGVLPYKLSVSAIGAVKSVSFEGSPFPESMHDCIRPVLARLRFQPPPSGAAVLFSSSLHFSPPIVLPEAPGLPAEVPSGAPSVGRTKLPAEKAAVRARSRGPSAAGREAPPGASGAPGAMRRLSFGPPGARAFSWQSQPMTDNRGLATMPYPSVSIQCRVCLPLLMLALLLLAGCKAKAGGSCKPDDQACADATTALLCQDGKYAAVACKGKAGCTEFLETARCDISGDAEGDPCPAGENNLTACSPDGLRQLRCIGGKISSRPCPADGHCKDRGEKGTSCALGEPEEGAPCSNISIPSCSFDTRSIFACHESKWARHAACSGKNGCKRGGLGAMCDATQVEVGAQCGAEARGKASCSIDRRSLMSCDGTAWKQGAACPEGQTCSFDQVDGQCEERLGCLMLPRSPTCR